MDEELPVIRAAQEFVVWLIPKIGKFPRDLRFTVGEKIERQGLAVLEGLIRARYARQRTPMLDAVNVDLEVLRFLLRIAHDLRALPTKSYGEACGRLLDIGKQVGGWRKSGADRAVSIRHALPSPTRGDWRRTARVSSGAVAVRLERFCAVAVWPPNSGQLIGTVAGGIAIRDHPATRFDSEFVWPIRSIRGEFQQWRRFVFDGLGS